MLHISRIRREMNQCMFRTAESDIFMTSSESALGLCTTLSDRKCKLFRTNETTSLGVISALSSDTTVPFEDGVSPSVPHRRLLAFADHLD